MIMIMLDHPNLGQLLPSVQYSIDKNGLARIITKGWDHKITIPALAEVYLAAYQSAQTQLP